MASTSHLARINSKTMTDEFEEKLKKLLITDYPTAWKILVTNKENHHEKCSWRVAGMLCDCAGQDAFIATFDYLRKELGLDNEV